MGTTSTDIRTRIKGGSPGLPDWLARIERVADTSLPVLILGETGTGKELAMRLVHHRSKGRQGLYQTLNCAAIPETLLESILFGYEGGAFTGALDNRPGIFEVASVRYGVHRRNRRDVSAASSEGPARPRTHWSMLSWDPHS